MGLMEEVVTRTSRMMRVSCVAGEGDVLIHILGSHNRHSSSLVPLRVSEAIDDTSYAALV